MALPALRNIDASTIQHEGETYILVRDAEEYVEDQLLLSPLAFFIASYLNGIHEVTDIQYIVFEQSGGRLVSDKDILSVVEYLDEHGFLCSERFEAIRRKVVAEFRAADGRLANLAGMSYPEDPEELRLFLDSLFLRGNGPGKRPCEAALGGSPLKCLVVPHIDYERGGHSYAHGYLRLAEGTRPRTVLVFGVAHSGAPAPFILTRKDYHTPLGRVRTDIEAVERLAAACEWDPFEHEIAHRTEHSIEFQAVMLAHLYGSETRMVPILCGQLTTDERVVDPSTIPQIGRFLATARDLVASSDDGVCVVAGADLAHVGRRFGDLFDVDDEVVRQVGIRDREDLGQAAALDAQGWYASVMKDQNQRRVCGLNCIYAALKSVEGVTGPGEVLSYDYAHDPAGGIVSFAGIAYPKKP